MPSPGWSCPGSGPLSDPPSSKERRGSCKRRNSKIDASVCEGAVCLIHSFSWAFNLSPTRPANVFDRVDSMIRSSRSRERRLTNSWARKESGALLCFTEPSVSVKRWTKKSDVSMSSCRSENPLAASFLRIPLSCRPFSKSSFGQSPRNLGFCAGEMPKSDSCRLIVRDMALSSLGFGASAPVPLFLLAEHEPSCKTDRAGPIVSFLYFDSSFGSRYCTRGSSLLCFHRLL
mmetsp:Transcript_27049/g.53071  ORF Transcript_27049/g.53071 Transcript_27049/m.53071 type:complete len:231 (-) Transcript_27049:58-750(-)